VLTSAKDKYHIASLLGRGSQGEVYLARRESDNQAVAIKKVRAGDPAVKDELAALRAVKGLTGFPEMFDEFYAGGGDHIVMTRLGRTIESIRKRGGVYHSLPESLVGSIGIQMVDRMEALHKVGFAHRDLYHYNAAMGLDGDRFKIVLIDFGVSRPIVGGRGRKADVKSLAHSMLTMLIQTPFKKHIGKTPLEEICKGVHPNVLKLFRYAYETLGDLETPDYEMLRTLLRVLAPGYNGLIQLE
jgi:serine/threonine protein kinase